MVAGLNEVPEALKAARDRIDDIDSRLISLIQERFGVAAGVVEIKRKAGLPALLQDRVDEVLDHVEALARAQGLPEGVARELWRVLISATIDFENSRL